MFDLNGIINALTVILLGVGARALYLLKAGTEAAAKTGAEEAVKNTLHDLHWPAELAQELQKARGVERQELRYKSYGALWKKLRPLAIYDDTDIDNDAMSALNTKLSDWYFSECGGLLLTPQTREFYFALQDLLRITSRFPEWRVNRSKASEGDHRAIFRGVLEKIKTDGDATTDVYEYFETGKFKTGKFKDWQDQALDLGRKWRDGIIRIANAWNVLNEQERFATLQQVGSILRTGLTIDLDSRLR